MTVLEKSARTGEVQAAYAGVAETHSACVFFVGDRAYKLKKPVNLGFLDFTSLAARTAACQRELELNRRFAPDVYLGIAAVRDPAGQVCDHLLVMRRMPADRRLSTLVERRANVTDQLRQVARTLAVQHAAASRSTQIARQGGRDALTRRWQDNVDQTRPFGSRLAMTAAIEQAWRLAERFLCGREPLFDARIRDGRIVDGHGDLLADDIFCLDEGPRILDCLDFDDTLRWVDGLDDASFLAMDLERLGAADLADRFTGWYMEYSADPAPQALRHHYVAYRAFVRAKVSCLRWNQGHRTAGNDARMLDRTRAGPSAGRRGHPGRRRGAAWHGEVHACGQARRPARVHRAEQRQDKKGPRRDPAGAVRRRSATAQVSTPRPGPNAPTPNCSAGPPGCFRSASR